MEVSGKYHVVSRLACAVMCVSRDLSNGAFSYSGMDCSCFREPVDDDSVMAMGPVDVYSISTGEKDKHQRPREENQTRKPLPVGKWKDKDKTKTVVKVTGEDETDVEIACQGESVSLRGNKSHGETCVNSNDCSVCLSVCHQGRCLCTLGLYYSPTQNACLDETQAVWIGLSDKYDNDTWYWGSGGRVSGRGMWGHGEPHNFDKNSKENCAFMNLAASVCIGRDSCWCDAKCGDKRAFVCARKRRP